MVRFPGRKAYLLVLALLAAGFWLVAPGPVLAGDKVEDKADNEMQFLKLYFSDEQLVEAPTRAPRSIMQVAEDVTIVTAEEIEALHAHTLAEVLNRVPGTYLLFFGQDFGSIADPHLQGSKREHTLVLVDGVRWNMINSNNANLNDIPLGIIKQIEVIRGPASSTWGSSLGGVVNILTKDIGTTVQPTAQISGSWGESQSLDGSVQVAGKAGRFGYFLYGGHQESDGLLDHRLFENESLYTKLGLDLPSNTDLNFTLAYNAPLTNMANWADWDWAEHLNNRSLLATAMLKKPIGSELGLTIAAHTLERKNFEESKSMETDATFGYNSWDDSAKGADARLVWQRGGQAAVFGAEIERGKMDYETLGQAPSDAGDETWAVYANDTISWGKVTVIPGLRYDRHSITDSVISPSLGAVYRVTDQTLLRATAARGFGFPPLSYLAGGGPGGVNNPDLAPEKIWSYQAGVETIAARYLWLRANAFYHQVQDTWEFSSAEGYWINSGESERSGGEFEMETVSFHDCSVGGNFSYVYEALESPGDSDEMYSTNLFFTYDDQQQSARLLGHYIWMNNVWMARDLWDGRSTGQYNDFLWDLILARKFSLGGNVRLELFGSIHNIFNSSQYYSMWYQNPGRWVEAGVTVRF